MLTVGAPLYQCVKNVSVDMWLNGLNYIERQFPNMATKNRKKKQQKQRHGTFVFVVFYRLNLTNDLWKTSTELLNISR